MLAVHRLVHRHPADRVYLDRLLNCPTIKDGSGKEFVSPAVKAGRPGDQILTVGGSGVHFSDIVELWRSAQADGPGSLATNYSDPARG